MTEAEWLACEEPWPLIEYLRACHRAARSKAGGRRLRLLACASCRELWDLLPESPHRRAVELSERYADGLVGRGTFVGQAGDLMRQPWPGADWLRIAAQWLLVTRALSTRMTMLTLTQAKPAASPDEHRARRRLHAHLTRDIWGNPFRPALVSPTWLTWDGGEVVRLAHTIYSDLAFDRLPILADALEDAGCTDAEFLGHLRGPGPHVRGCWAVDLLLGKS